MGKPMTKSDIAKAIAAETELKNSTASKIMNSLAEIITKEVKSTGKITIPGVVMIKTLQASHQGVQEGDLRQIADGQGKASTHDCQGLPRCGLEEERVRLNA